MASTSSLRLPCANSQMICHWLRLAPSLALRYCFSISSTLKSCFSCMRLIPPLYSYPFQGFRMSPATKGDLTLARKRDVAIEESRNDSMIGAEDQYATIVEVLLHYPDVTVGTPGKK